MSSHQNIHGECPKCNEILDKYPGFSPELRMWFGFVRRSFFDFHISEAGRGKIDQQADYERGASRAQYGESPHNWNGALDTFFLDPAAPGHYSLSRAKYAAVFERCPLGSAFTWYGAKGATFPEVPHIQLTNWRDMAQRGDLKLVELA